MTQSLPGITKLRGTQASDSRVLMLSDACGMVVATEALLCSQGWPQQEGHINGSHYSHLGEHQARRRAGRTCGKINLGSLNKKISG